MLKVSRDIMLIYYFESLRSQSYFTLNCTDLYLYTTQKDFFDALKYTFTGSTTKGACVPDMISSVLHNYVCMPGSHVFLESRAWLAVTVSIVEHLRRRLTCSPSPFPPLFNATVIYLPTVWGLMAGLPRFASHGNSLHLGAGF